MTVEKSTFTRLPVESLLRVIKDRTNFLDGLRAGSTDQRGLDVPAAGVDDVLVTLRIPVRALAADLARGVFILAGIRASEDLSDPRVFDEQVDKLCKDWLTLLTSTYGLSLGPLAASFPLLNRFIITPEEYKALRVFWRNPEKKLTAQDIHRWYRSALPGLEEKGLIERCNDDRADNPTRYVCVVDQEAVERANILKSLASNYDGDMNGFLFEAAAAALLQQLAK